MLQLRAGDGVGIIALSNGLSKSQSAILTKLEELFRQWELEVFLAKDLYRQDTIYAATDKRRAQMLMEFYQDKRIKAIFDVSGGDLANGVLPYLDYELIARKSKLFFGYSDLTVVLNALYTKTNQSSTLYQVRNLVGAHACHQQARFRETLFQKKKSLWTFNYHWIQGKEMAGVVIGGNIRCLLKLAGTPYFPNCRGKLLLLESLSGHGGKIATYLNQLKQLGVFEQINGLILGTFTEMEASNNRLHLITLVQTILDNDQMPMIKTNEIGHQSDSKAVVIGQELQLQF